MLNCLLLATDTQPVPKKCSASLSQVSPVYGVSMMFHGMEYPFGQFTPAVLAVFPLSCLCTCSLADHETLKSPQLRVSTAQQQLKCQCVINAILILNPKCSTVPANKKKINSNPAENERFFTWKRGNFTFLWYPEHLLYHL